MTDKPFGDYCTNCTIETIKKPHRIESCRDCIDLYLIEFFFGLITDRDMAKLIHIKIPENTS